MNIDWKRIQNQLKFHLGMKCVVRYGDKWVVTCRELLFIRCVLGSLWSDNLKGNWWPKEYIKNWAVFSTEQAALDALEDHKKACKMRAKLNS